VYQRGSRWKSTHLTLRVLRHRPLAQRPQKKLPDEQCDSADKPTVASGVISATDAMQAGLVEVASAKPRLPQAVNIPRATRVGVSVSTKVSKRSVVRNQIKRRIQAILYQHLAQFSMGWDLVVVVHPPAVECDYAGFLQELEQLLMEAEVWNGH
jgi:ribonuclease P protein component